MKEQIKKIILELWHTSHAISFKRHDRIIYVHNNLVKDYPMLIKGMNNKQIWFCIEDIIN
jgi:hypothetical protein